MIFTHYFRFINWNKFIILSHLILLYKENILSLYSSSGGNQLLNILDNKQVKYLIEIIFLNSDVMKYISRGTT
jgi:hypothetical protein